MTFSPICRPWDGNTSTSPAITSGHPICRKPSTDCEPCVPPPPTFAKLPDVLVLAAYATISHEPLVPAQMDRDRVIDVCSGDWCGGERLDQYSAGAADSVKSLTRWARRSLSRAR